MKTLLIPLIALFALNAKAMTPAEVETAIHQQMNQHHPDVPANFWTNLGSDAVPVLENLYTNSSSVREQTWLLAGLSHYTDPGIASFLEGKIESGGNSILKRKALESLIQSQGDSVYDFTEPYLQDKDPHIRLAVAKGMRIAMSGDKVSQRLARYQSDEKEVWVKTDFAKAEAPRPKVNKVNAPLDTGKPKVIPVKPLPEKDWAGLWKGILLSGDKSQVANVTMILQDKTWKIGIKLPKQTKYDLKPGFEVLYYQTDNAHWIEVRDKKEDSVFIGKRSAR